MAYRLIFFDTQKEGGESMKKLTTLILTLVLLMAFTLTTFAHPAVPTQSIGNVSPNAARGLHTAWGNIQDSSGIAPHVFLGRFSPH